MLFWLILIYIGVIGIIVTVVFSDPDIVFDEDDTFWSGMAFILLWPIIFPLKIIKAGFKLIVKAIRE